jgi:hypothetical protein
VVQKGEVSNVQVKNLLQPKVLKPALVKTQKLQRQQT